MTRARMILRYVLVGFLCLLGFWLTGASGMAFFPPHGQRDVQSVAIGVVFLGAGVGLFILANVIHRKALRIRRTLSGRPM